MRWGVFAIFAFVGVVLDTSLGNVLSFRTITPSFTAVIVVFTSLFAPRTKALWACWGLGLLIDLCTDVPLGPDRVGPVIGPNTLGYVFGGIVIIQIRAMLFRSRALTMAVMTVLFLLVVAIVVVVVDVMQGWYAGERPVGGLRPLDELFRRLGGALYTGLLALVLARVLVWTIPIWSFRTKTTRHVVWR